MSAIRKGLRQSGASRSQVTSSSSKFSDRKPRHEAEGSNFRPRDGGRDRKPGFSRSNNSFGGSDRRNGYNAVESDSRSRLAEKLSRLESAQYTSKPRSFDRDSRPRTSSSFGRNDTEQRRRPFARDEQRSGETREYRPRRSDNGSTSSYGERAKGQESFERRDSRDSSSYKTSYDKPEGSYSRGPRRTAGSENPSSGEWRSKLGQDTGSGGFTRSRASDETRTYGVRSNDRYGRGEDAARPSWPNQDRRQSFEKSYSHSSSNRFTEDKGLRMSSPAVPETAGGFSSGRSERFGTADDKRDRRRDRVAEREFADPAASKDYIKFERTTAASEYIYGRSAVLEALKAGTRKFYKLYLARGSETDPAEFEVVYKHGLNRGVEAVWVTNTRSQFEMDRLTKGRPHNGVILEAGPLPKLPVLALKPAQKGINFEVELKHQSKEDAVVNGQDPEIAYDSSFSRYPFVIMLDGVVDQGNVGGILRSAYFLGADAVVLSSHIAPMTAVTLKAASGAAECVKLLSVHNTTGFLQASKDNGWKVYASIAPPTAKSPHKSKHIDLSALGQPLQESPSILLLGSEGEGLRDDLIYAADQTISITGPRSNQGGVDSLNVSVAAGILMDAFLKPPPQRQVKSEGETTGAAETEPLF